MKIAEAKANLERATAELDALRVSARCARELLVKFAARTRGNAKDAKALRDRSIATIDSIDRQLPPPF